MKIAVIRANDRPLKKRPDNACAVESWCHQILQRDTMINARFFHQRVGLKRVEELSELARTFKKFDREETLGRLK